jgi:hypothetical protein
VFDLVEGGGIELNDVAFVSNGEVWNVFGQLIGTGPWLNVSEIEDFFRGVKIPIAFNVEIERFDIPAFLQSI